MNTIHMRFIGKRNEIIGYGKIIQDTEIPFAVFMISDDGVKWEYRSASARSYHPPERGIEVRGEVWYEGDILSFIGKDGRELTGTLAWNEEYMMFVVIVKVGCLDPISLFMFEIKNVKCIGNTHKGDKP